MKSEQPVTLRRNCEAAMIPSGEKIVLSSGSTVWVTQSPGGSYTVMTDRGYMARIEGKDGDAIGLKPDLQNKPHDVAGNVSRETVEHRVWEQLRTCFDPEIPVNIVDLGLIYACEVRPCDTAGYRAQIKFTLTARGCGMGQFLRRDIQNKLSGIAGIREVEVELVWDPPWNQSMISHTAKQQLGIE